MRIVVSNVFDLMLPLICVLGLVGLAVRKMHLRRPRHLRKPRAPEAAMTREQPATDASLPDDELPDAVTDDAVVLADDVLVYDAKVLAKRLEQAGIPFRMELVQDDRSFRIEGHCGFGQRLRVYVPAADFVRARRFAQSPSLQTCDAHANSTTF